MASIDGTLSSLLAGVSAAVAVLHPDESLDAVLRRLGRSDVADALVADETAARTAAWDLAAELNERRQL